MSDRYSGKRMTLHTPASPTTQFYVSPKRNNVTMTANTPCQNMACFQTPECFYVQADEPEGPDERYEFYFAGVNPDGNLVLMYDRGANPSGKLLPYRTCMWSALTY